ncbi:hypothetical protein BH10PLA1_BH10PLA1_18470 [soil metagenome]
MSSIVTSSLSQNDILKWLGEYVASHWAISKYPVSGTRAHKVVEDQFGKLDYRFFGADRFKEFLQPGDGKYYRVLITGTRHGIYPLDVNVETPTIVLKRSNHMKPEVWAAFMRARSHYFDRSAGEFRAGTVTHPETQITVERIDEQTQKKWASIFVAQRHPEGIEAVQKILDTPTWSWDLAGPAGYLSPNLRSAWKRYRFEKVVEVAQAWCESHGIQTEIFSSPRPPVQELGTIQPSAPVQSSVSNKQTNHGRDNLRQTLLQALETMSTDELSRLPIPPCYILPFLTQD